MLLLGHDHFFVMF